MTPVPPTSFATALDPIFAETAKVPTRGGRQRWMNASLPCRVGRTPVMNRRPNGLRREQVPSAIGRSLRPTQRAALMSTTSDAGGTNLTSCIVRMAGAMPRLSGDTQNWSGGVIENWPPRSGGEDWVGLDGAWLPAAASSTGATDADARGGSCDASAAWSRLGVAADCGGVGV